LIDMQSYLSFCCYRSSQ